jgi:hypothetical protein
VGDNRVAQRGIGCAGKHRYLHRGKDIACRVAKHCKAKDTIGCCLDENFHHEVLDDFAAEYPVQAEVVKLRYFVGMTNEETAQTLGISVGTVKNYWTFAPHLDF